MGNAGQSIKDFVYMEIKKEDNIFKPIQAAANIYFLLKFIQDKGDNIIGYEYRMRTTDKQGYTFDAEYAYRGDVIIHNILRNIKEWYFRQKPQRNSIFGDISWKDENNNTQYDLSNFYGKLYNIETIVKSFTYKPIDSKYNNK